MEENKKNKIKKPYLIIFTIAIVFAIFGFIDLKSNATESLIEDIPYAEQYINTTYLRHNYQSDTYYKICEERSNPSSRMALYYGDINQRILDPNNLNKVITSTGKGYVICCDESIRGSYWRSKASFTTYDSKRVVTSYDENSSYSGSWIYPSLDTIPSDFENFASYVFYMDVGSYTDSNFLVEICDIDTNIPIFTDWNALTEYIDTGLYNPSHTVIDYDTSKYTYDDTIPVPDSLSYSVQTIHSVQDDLFSHYILASWKNTSNDYTIEVELQPYANKSSINMERIVFTFGEGDMEKIDSEFYGDWFKWDILNPGTSRKMYAYDDLFMNNDLSVWWNKIKSENFSSFDNLMGRSFNRLINYRIRYIDPVYKRYGSWRSVIFAGNTGYKSYIQNDLNNVIDQSDFNKGFHNVTDSVGTIDNIDTGFVNDIANERQDYFEEFGTSNTYSVGDITEAKNWLSSVATFIKDTPSFVASVMSFLPQPILYGLFVCIFLSVIAAGYAIIKALI